MVTDQDKSAVSEASVAPVAAATQSYNAQLKAVDSNASKREFGTVAYERVLPKDECFCIERTSKKLQSLDDIVHIWVRDARSFLHGNDCTVPYYSLRVVASISVDELRNLIEEHYTRLSSYRKEVDGPLLLCYDDQMLSDEESFAVHLPGGDVTVGPTSVTGQQKLLWPKPFAGIVWVLSSQN